METKSYHISIVSQRQLMNASWRINKPDPGAPHKRLNNPLIDPATIHPERLAEMEQKSANNYFPTVGDGSGLAQNDGLYKEELQLALRNSGMPLEALRYPVTPTGLHYLLIHYDIPEINADPWRLKIAGLSRSRLN